MCKSRKRPAAARIIQVRKLYPGQDAAEIIRRQDTRRIRTGIALLLIWAILTAVLAIDPARMPDETRKLLQLLVTAGCILWLFREQQAGREAMKKRKRQLEQDYPDLLTNFTLLIQAGMTISGAWKRVCRDYEAGLKRGEPFRYAFEEMRITAEEILNGGSESSAYLEFGRRIGLQEYIRFGTILDQNLRQGSGLLRRRLEEELKAAQLLRKQRAVRAGEEAQTKLLFPMMMLLVVILLLVMVPAWLQI